MAADIAPPSDLDAEAAVLSVLLLNPDAIADIDQVLQPREFYSASNKIVAEAIWELDRRQEPIDAATVARQLKDRDQLQRIGGTPYLGRLMDSTPAIAHVEAHAKIVSDLSRVRHVQAECARVRAEGFGEIGDIPTWLASSEAALLNALDRREIVDTQQTIQESVGDEYDRMREQDAPSQLLGLSTGLPWLDSKTCGLEDGFVYVLAARPGIGKTALALQLAMTAAPQLAQQNRAVFFASLEMPRQQLTQRALASESGVPMDRIRKRALGSRDWEALTAAIDRIQSLPVLIDDRAAQSPQGLRSGIRRGLRRMPGSPTPGLIVVDYLQLMQPAGGRQRGSNREQEVSGFSGAMTAMAKEFRCPIIELSQLSRAGSSEKNPRRPRLEDLRESGAIEQDGYGIMFLHRPDPADEGTAELILAKNRNGPTGKRTMRYMGQNLRFYELEGEPDESEWDSYGTTGEGFDNSEERYP